MQETDEVSSSWWNVLTMEGGNQQPLLRLMVAIHTSITTITITVMLMR